MQLFNLYRKAKRFIVREDAATVVEYTLMLTIIVAVLLSALQILGPAASTVFMDTSNGIAVSEDGGL